LLGRGRRYRAATTERGATFLHHSAGLRRIPASGESAHEQPISRLAQWVRRNEFAPDALGFVRAVPIDLRLTDGFEGLHLDVAKRPAFGGDPCAILAGKETPHGDLIRDNGLRPGVGDVALTQEGLEAMPRPAHRPRSPGEGVRKR